MRKQALARVYLKEMTSPKANRQTYSRCSAQTTIENQQTSFHAEDKSDASSTNQHADIAVQRD
ncbi:MAG: hypothetical protein ACI4PM_03235, partial [Butyricicoccus sp.]